MDTQNDARYYVAIIGAGPAGLFAARELAEQGIHSVIFNRDIKPGGLAEYGIYPTKLKMKEGLRNQFRQILSRGEVDYYGNVVIGENADLTMNNLREMGFQAILVTVGAQSTKKLGIPGEDLAGVYHAKDIVYHYNLLPPFSKMSLTFGKSVAIIGVGNVMVDVARWLIDEKNVERVVAVARRGPGDIKFDRKEIEDIINCLDMSKLVDELDRVGPRVQSVGQDPKDLLKMISDVAAKMPPTPCNSSLSLRFLSTPIAILGDENGKIKGLQLEENDLVLSAEGQSRPVATGTMVTLDVNNVIFAIGDEVDGKVGLPVSHGEFSKNPQPRFPVEGVSYEVFDSRNNRPVTDIFLAGWARKPSTGLVGVARKDAGFAVQAVVRYLQNCPPTTEPVAERASEKVMKLEKRVINKRSLLRLENIERDRARDLRVPTFKFATNEEMLAVLFPD